MKTDAHRCTQMHTDRKKNIQTSTKIGRKRNGERERGGGSRKKGQTEGRNGEKGNMERKGGRDIEKDRNGGIDIDRRREERE